MDYLLIEAVNALRASSAVATARAKRIEREMVEAGLLPAPAPAKAQQNRDSVESSSKQRVSGDDGGDDEDEDVRIRLEAIGRHVGASFAERSSSPSSSSPPPLTLTSTQTMSRSRAVLGRPGRDQVRVQGGLGGVLGQAGGQSAHEPPRPYGHQHVCVWLTSCPRTRASSCCRTTSSSLWPASRLGRAVLGPRDEPSWCARSRTTALC